MTKNQNVEISWSLMHPTPLNTEYMRQVVKEADSSPVKVDSFEICAMCHSTLGGLDGLGHYDGFDLPGLDHKAIDENIRKLTEILDIAHRSGRPVYYWHREVTVPHGLVGQIPGLLDEKGEFDLLGSAYENLIRLKFKQAYDNIPDLDGVVLTLTEADFSAIHNSTPEKYPPAEVVRKVAGIFYDELTKRGKRFILRSFGSIAQDYQDILAGAKLLAAEGKHFEVETKITPYDFDPFLPENPFLEQIDGLTLSAECDSLGEFLGAGRLPAHFPEYIVNWVRSAQKAGVSRFAIRTDRKHSSVFDTYPVNLSAYMRAITEKEVTSDTVREEYFTSRYGKETGQILNELGKKGLSAVLKAHFVRGNVVFHENPPEPSFKYLKAGGFFANFKENIPLKNLENIWAVLSHQTTASRSEILEEKLEALSIAQNGLEKIESLKSSLSEADYAVLLEQWQNLFCCCSSMAAFCRCVCAYFDDMESQDAAGTRLASAITEAEKVYAQWAHETQSAAAFVNGMEENKCDDFRAISQVYPAPLETLSEMLSDEFSAEFAARTDKELDGAIDFIIPGAITDEWRCERAMHACHGILKNGRPCRIVGNQVFPNGTLGFTLEGNEKPMVLYLKGYGSFNITVNGRDSFNAVLNGTQEFALNCTGKVHIKLNRNGGTDYPEIFAAALFNK
jgi:hypothetical protein